MKNTYIYFSVSYEKKQLNCSSEILLCKTAPLPTPICSKFEAKCSRTLFLIFLFVPSVRWNVPILFHTVPLCSNCSPEILHYKTTPLTVNICSKFEAKCSKTLFVIFLFVPSARWNVPILFYTDPLLQLFLRNPPL